MAIHRGPVGRGVIANPSAQLQRYVFLRIFGVYMLRGQAAGVCPRLLPWSRCRSHFPAFMSILDGLLVLKLHDLQPQIGYQ